MAKITPKVEKLKTLLEQHIQAAKNLLKEGEELNYEALEEELAGIVTRALSEPDKGPAPVPFAAAPASEQSKPVPRERIQEAAQRLRALREAIAAADTEYLPKRKELLEGLKKVRSQMEEARQKATEDYKDLYEACAKRFEVNMDEDGWKSKVHRHLKKTKFLR